MRASPEKRVVTLFGIGIPPFKPKHLLGGEGEATASVTLMIHKALP